MKFVRSIKRPHRRGQAMVEFAIISFVLTAMLAGFLGIIVMGLGSFQNNIAAENAGRVLDGHEVFIKENFVTHFEADGDDPFTANDDLENITARQVYRFLIEYPFDQNDPDRRLYDESRLIISREDWDNRADLGLSAINESLLGQYIFDPDLTAYDPDLLTDDDNDGEFEYEGITGAYRFPGAVVRKGTGTSYTLESGEVITVGGLTVLIPLIPKSDSANGIDRSFHVTPTAAQLMEIEDHYYPVSEDWVAPIVIGREQNGNGSEFRVIMFHPSQPASMTQIRLSVDDNGRPVRVDENGLPDPNGFYQFPVEADDNATGNLIGDPPTGYELVVAANANPGGRAASYAGRFGLGQTFAFVETLRPYRAVFETSSLFRMGARLNPIYVKYEADGNVIPMRDESSESSDPPITDTAVAPFDVGAGAYEESGHDQSLAFGQLVVDGSEEARRRYMVNDPINDTNPLRDYMTPSPADANNDFVEHVLWLQPNDGGLWKVSVAAELKTNGVPAAEWEVNHVLQLSLYKNGVRERLITTHNVTSSHSEPISLTGQALIDAEEGDVLQVRVFTDDQQPTLPPPYEVQLTGDRATNWVSFERIGD